MSQVVRFLSLPEGMSHENHDVWDHLRPSPHIRVSGIWFWQIKPYLRCVHGISKRLWGTKRGFITHDMCCSLESNAETNGGVKLHWALTELFFCLFKVDLVGGDWNMTFIFPNIGNNHPNWLRFFKGVETNNQGCFCGWTAKSTAEHCGWDNFWSSNHHFCTIACDRRWFERA